MCTAVALSVYNALAAVTVSVRTGAGDHVTFDDVIITFATIAGGQVNTESELNCILRHFSTRLFNQI